MFPVKLRRFFRSDFFSHFLLDLLLVKIFRYGSFLHDLVFSALGSVHLPQHDGECVHWRALTTQIRSRNFQLPYLHEAFLVSVLHLIPDWLQLCPSLSSLHTQKSDNSDPGKSPYTVHIDQRRHFMQWDLSGEPWAPTPLRWNTKSAGIIVTTLCPLPFSLHLTLSWSTIEYKFWVSPWCFFLYYFPCVGQEHPSEWACGG